MTAYNVVRMRVKPGRGEEYIALHRDLGNDKPVGLQRFEIVKTGDRDYCIIGAWDSMDALAAARPKMIGNLDRLRDMLEELGGGVGVTDPVSGESVLTLK